MTSLQIRGISKDFPNGLTVLSNVSIDVAAGEFLTLLGPSGCGKTTLLKIIAGFHPASAGQILIGGEDVTALPPERRNTAMCFQSYALFPHMTVTDNILFGPRQNRIGREECHRRLAAALRQVDLHAHAEKLPSALSGGQQQRVALARAMAMRPGIILFDEPLSNLDAKLREQVRFEIRALQAEQGFTAIYVTHDQAEALAMSDRIVVMRGGHIEQIGTPTEIYDRPVSRFVADFIGAANILEAEFVGGAGADGGHTVQTDLGIFDIATSRPPTSSRHYISWRPENAELVSETDAACRNTFAARVVTQAFQGSVTDVVLRPEGVASLCRIQTRRPLAADALVRVRLAPHHFATLEVVP